MTPRELVEYVARALVDYPDDVRVAEAEGDRSVALELRVARADIGRIIGREGRIVNALRTILAVSAAREGRRVTLDVIAEGEQPPPGPRRSC